MGILEELVQQDKVVDEENKKLKELKEKVADVFRKEYNLSGERCSLYHTPMSVSIYRTGEVCIEFNDDSRLMSGKDLCCSAIFEQLGAKDFRIGTSFNYGFKMILTL